MTASATHVGRYPRRPESVRDVRACARKVLDDCPRCDDAELVVSELATNATVHAVGATFEVVIERRAGTVRIEVTDEARPGGAPVVVEPDLYAESQRGLFLVAQVAEHFGHRREDGRTVAWAELAWDEDSEEAHGDAAGPA